MTSQKLHQTSSRASSLASWARLGGPSSSGHLCVAFTSQLRTTALRISSVGRHMHFMQDAPSSSRRRIGVCEVPQSCVWVCTSCMQEDTPASEHSDSSLAQASGRRIWLRQNRSVLAQAGGRRCWKRVRFFWFTGIVTDTRGKGAFFTCAKHANASHNVFRNFSTYVRMLEVGCARQSRP